MLGNVSLRDEGMAELKQGGKGGNSNKSKPRLGDILEQRKIYQNYLDNELFKAISRGDPPADWAKVTMLVKSGADPNVLNLFGGNALMLSILEGNREACEFLLENGADVNRQTPKHKQTALMYAALQNYARICRLLVEKGAEIDAEDIKGCTALMLARKAKANRAVGSIVEAALKRISVCEPKAFLLEFRECVKG
jgi:26S proteasome non-ATPase regulatory subunit 10